MHALQAVLVAIGSFSIVASAIYVVNDVADVRSDRGHPTKQHRPLAAGRLTIGQALVLVPILLGVSAWISLSWLPEMFSWWLLVYVALTTAYSFGLKRIMILSILYTLRFMAGGAAAGVEVSPWLLMLSLFLFTSLAFVKRFTELLDAEHRRVDIAHGRGYVVSDLQMIRSLGPAIGFIGILVFVQYINSDDVTKLYTHPLALWLAVPPLMYWLARMWFIANRRQMHDDPIVFAVRDAVSYAVAALIAVIAYGAR
jgi:4-hydroxybenzoate polyprenyltransferase